MNNVKIVAVGDGGIGKTSLLLTSTTDTPFGAYVPTIFDSYTYDPTVDNVPYHLCFWDTLSSEGYDRLRPLSYPQTDVFLLCFSCDNVNSMLNIETFWLPEIMHHVPSARFGLICTKIDLRDDTATVDRLHLAGEQPITHEDGERLANKIGAHFYHETSAKQSIGLVTLMEKIIRQAFLIAPVPRPPRRHAGSKLALCVLM